MSHCAGGFRGAGHGARHGDSQRRQASRTSSVPARAHHAFERSAAGRRTAAVTRGDPLARYEAASASSDHRRTDAVPRGQRLRAAAVTGARRAPARSIRCTPIPMQDTSVAHAGDPIFVRVVDLDRNRDGDVIETVDVRVTVAATGDSEVLRLSETGAEHRRVRRLHRDRDRARPATTARCRSSAMPSSTPPMSIRRTPPTRRRPMRWSILTDSCSIRRPARRSTARACVSSTSPPVLPATVFGDDGVSRYPSEMVTGQVVTDQGGTQYSMPAGVFRFPLVAPGSYRLEVLPPGSHAFPSQRTIADLQTLPNAPYPPAAGLVRPGLRRHRGARRRGRRAARFRRRLAAAAQDAPASRSRPPATSCSTR